MNLALDGLINFSYQPLRLIALLGALVGGVAFACGVLFLILYLTDTAIFGYNPRAARGWTSLILSVLFLSGTQLFGIGVLGEYIGRMFEEMKQRPMYIVETLLNIERDRATPADGRAPSTESATGGAVFAHVARASDS
jgi:hypothetical protein